MQQNLTQKWYKNFSLNFDVEFITFKSYSSQSRLASYSSDKKKLQKGFQDIYVFFLRDGNARLPSTVDWMGQSVCLSVSSQKSLNYRRHSAKQPPINYRPGCRYVWVNKVLLALRIDEQITREQAWV